MAAKFLRNLLATIALVGIVATLPAGVMAQSLSREELLEIRQELRDIRNEIRETLAQRNAADRHSLTRNILSEQVARMKLERDSMRNRLAYRRPVSPN